IDADDLADTDAVARSDGYVMLGPSGPIGDVAVADDWPHLSRVPPLLVSPDALGDGDAALPIGFIVTTEQPLARNERDVVRSVVGDGLTIEFHQPPEPSSGLRAIALLSGALLG